ncbi:MAG: FliA/WhiG family RNA polymerase sigma factor [Bdellovibrionota bacterium]
MNSKNLNGIMAYKHVSNNEKDEMIRAYLPLVKKVVNRLLGRVPKGVDVKEMINSGIIGLVDALEKFDPGKDTNFATYARFRIQGSILDSFRSQDWLPRSLRKKTHEIEEAYRQVEVKHGRPARDEEVAKVLGISLDEFNKRLGEISNIVMISFEELGYGHGEDRFSKDDVLESKSKDPLFKLLSSEKVELVARSLDRLPEKERLVISLYFYEELNLKEIGEIIGVTESRASQIRSRALIRLKTYLKNIS